MRPETRGQPPPGTGKAGAGDLGRARSVVNVELKFRAAENGRATRKRPRPDGAVGTSSACRVCSSNEPRRPSTTCLLYTSDAADDLLCVDLGGRRIIKKKKNHNNKHQ